MRWTKLLLVVGVGLLTACSQADNGGGQKTEVATNGQTGSPGYSCETDECAELAHELLGWIDEKPTPVFVDSKCQEGSDIGSAETLAVRSCKCIADDGYFDLIAATGGGAGAAAAPAANVAGGEAVSDDSVVTTEPCLVWGRGHLACLYPASEAASCEPSEPRACDAMCARLQRGYADAAALDYDAVLRLAECRAPSPGDTTGDRCAFVVSINGGCYTSENSGFLNARRYDCSLTDDEILAQHGGASTGSGGTGTGGGGP